MQNTLVGLMAATAGHVVFFFFFFLYCSNSLKCYGPKLYKCTDVPSTSITLCTLKRRYWHYFSRAWTVCAQEFMRDLRDGGKQSAVWVFKDTAFELLGPCQ